ncbi:zinc finger protein 135 isoform X2 [Dunckerocampus dactyliophorus]|uniref:zinc finger protein 135 isoform X2 n=1 Tax=Dunckerocampus dactyliophorus TaxID=161453 RepID=UPI002404AF3B|nr:zinc finger protein 135 isoform X2 [Dunckerocampus dactyliophorus]
MLKELVKERLMAAAEDIFAMFERTIASYEEELCQTREEKERHRRQLEAVYSVVLHVKDAKQLIDHQEERPPQPQGGSATLKQADAQPPHVKEEEEERWLEEADPTKSPLTVVAVKTEAHEDKPPESSRWLCPSDVQPLIGRQEERPTQQEPQSPHVKEEEELWITQEGERLLGLEEADLTKLPLTVVCLKTEDHEDKPPESSKLHHSPSEENRWAELPSCSSSQHMSTEADGDHRGGSRADNLLAPLSDSDNGDDTQEPLSSDPDWEGEMRTHTDHKHSGHAKKKTHEIRFTCSVCAKGFSYMCDLTRHMRTHTGEKPYGCSVCGNTFSQRSILKTHMKIHTGEKPFGCPICSARFFRKSHVVLHMRTHTGEKPFSCLVCGRRFAQRYILKTHMRTHTGEKPFSCSLCGERFAQKVQMVAHTKVHTGEKKPFSCSICGAGFFRKAHAASHMRTHAGEKTS